MCDCENMLFWNSSQIDLVSHGICGIITIYYESHFIFEVVLASSFLTTGVLLIKAPYQYCYVRVLMISPQQWWRNSDAIPHQGGVWLGRATISWKMVSFAHRFLALKITGLRDVDNEDLASCCSTYFTDGNHSYESSTNPVECFVLISVWMLLELH